MNILITGAKGMLGQDLVEILDQQGFSTYPTDIDTLDITDLNAVNNCMNSNKFDFIIHTAAYTDVDGAETNQNKAFLINEKGTENLAVVSGKLNMPILYISTDYIFDGTKNSPYEPDDTPCPINVYGLSKLKGEQAVQRNNPNHYIARTSWLYGHRGKNFVETMISLAKQKPELRVVDDQIGCPTWSVDLSLGIIDLIKNQKPYGIYHVCGSGHTSWHGFAVKILELANINTKVIPVPTEEFPRPARRPRFSIMNNNNICQDWEKAIEEYINRR